MALSRDGNRFVTGSNDRTIRLHDLATGRAIRVFQGHTEAVTCVALTTDGKRLVSGSEDGSTRIWDMESGKELCRLLTLRDGTWLVMDETGRFDSSTNSDITGVHWVDGMATSPLRHREHGLLAKLLAGNQ